MTYPFPYQQFNIQCKIQKLFLIFQLFNPLLLYWVSMSTLWLKVQESSIFSFFKNFFYFFLLLTWFLKKTRLLQSINQWRMREEYQLNSFWGPRRPKRQFLAMSDNYGTLNSFTLLGADQNQSNSFNRLSLRAH